jgi:predicted naringenin-chalcone synthase
MSKIISIGTAVPEFGTQQSTILHFMQSAYNDDTASRKLNVLFHQSNINTRYSVVPDFDNTQPAQNFFTGNQIVPGIEERLSMFKERAIILAIAAIHNSLKELKTTLDEFNVTHLITVSCTGIFAPGIDAVLIEQLNLPNDIFHTSFNFLGCNAAFHALKLGDMIAKTDENAKVLIVCVELCTLHFQPKNNHDNLLSNTIFGDGAAAVVMISDTAAKQKPQPGLTINGFYSLLLNKGKDLMGWNITPVNFEMILDARVPDFIGKEVNDIVLKVGRKLAISPSAIDKWAIHPGGKKILNTIKKQLNLDDDDLKYSNKVLSEYGNMSSPTILFVLYEIMKADHRPGETIFSIGFGPGLSIETAVYTYAE